MNTFRRMAWIEGDVDSHLPFLNSLQMQVGYRAKAFATLWAAMVDPTWVGH